jgi:protein-S-isoprenylcysteine O-methyltransferase Ste14
VRLKKGNKNMQKPNNTDTTTYPRTKIKHVFFYASIFITVPILTYLMGSFLDDVFLFPSFPPFPTNLVLGSVIFCTGLAIGIKATRTLFKKGRGFPWGEFNGKSQSKTLVTDGIYAYTRNPMVLGYSLLPCGMGIMFQSISMTIIIPALTLFVSAGVAKTREEPRLHERFGAAYSEYKKNTPFLIPRVKPLIVDLNQSTLPIANEGDANRLRHARIMQVTFYLISLLSLGILAALTLTAQQGTAQVQKESISIAFGVICVLGIIAGISPSRCNRLFIHFQTGTSTHTEGRSKSQGKREISYKGHHPVCGSFSSHVIQIGSKTYCAGCAGLVVGATIALMGTALYVFLQDPSAQLVAVSFWAGLVGVTLALLQYELFVGKASVHLLLNVIFVVAALLLLIGVNEMNGSLSLGVYFFLVILFLINVRSTLSRLEHEKKCATCKAEDCGVK